jgi:capsule polysaccharide export protein KpsE/RkpR
VASGSSVDQLSAAIDQLLAVMGGTLDEFNRKFEENTTRITGGAQQQMEADRKLIATCEEQLKSIQAQIASLQTKMESEQSNVQSETARLDGVRQGFQGAYEQIVGRLKAQKSRITSQPKA